MRIGVIGCGKMGRALLEGVLNAKIVSASETYCYDSYVPTLEALNELGVHQCASIDEIAENSDLVLLCVKPQDLPPIAQTLGQSSSSPLLVSIAAGVTIATIEEAAGKNSRVIRVMPNTPALIGKGAAAYAKGIHATASDAETVGKILSAVGSATEVKESLLNAVTGLSGSGPAYVYTIIEALADGGCLKGIPKADALQLAAQTVAGAAEMVLQTGEHPSVLRDQVTSPGGTTIAGLSALEENGLRNALISAVSAATERADELG